MRQLAARLKAVWTARQAASTARQSAEAAWTVGRAASTVRQSVEAVRMADGRAPRTRR